MSAVQRSVIGAFCIGNTVLVTIVRSEAQMDNAFEDVGLVRCIVRMTSASTFQNIR